MTHSINSEHLDARLIKQLELEKEMADRGRDRYYGMVQKNKETSTEAQTSYARIILKRGIEPMTKALDEFIAQASSGKAGRKHSAVGMLKGLKTEVVVFIALRKLLDKVSSEKSMKKLALGIAREIELEKKLHVLHQGDKERYEYTQFFLRDSANRKRKSNVLKYAFNKSTLVEFETWRETDCLHLGTKLLELAETHTGIIEIALEKAKATDQYSNYCVSLTNKCKDWIEAHKEHASILNPDYYPTLVQPKEWTASSGGGYFSEYIPELTLVKVGNTQYHQALDKRIEAGDMKNVLSAINAIQNTSWTVNTDILEVIKVLWNEANGGVAGLPSREDLTFPHCPFCGKDITDTVLAKVSHACFEKLDCDLERQAFREWKKATMIIREKNISLMSKRMNLAKTLQIAEKFKDEPEFFYPYQLDFRGRLYTVPTYLTPQGTGIAKSLLKFTKGKALGSAHAVKWLAIHGANVYGNDKISLDDRYAWVLQNQDAILACAKDPYSVDFWLDADEPLLFLAFCMEWQGFVSEGLDFVSHLPIAMDGTCNGLQIYSLILRDEVGGFATNLTPTLTPQDIYGIVAEKVVNTINERLLDIDHEDWEVVNFLSKLIINRKTTKRQVMVLPYGGTLNSCKEYTEQWLIETLDGMQNISFPATHHNPRKVAGYLAQIIWDMIEGTVIKAREAMVFLQKVATITNKANIPLRWTTPLGFTVVQEYKDTKSRVVKTKLGDKIIKLNLDETTDTINKPKQKSGIAPNFVHSLDASALMYTVNSCVELGLTDFALIHDSYGVHASDSHILAKKIREAFIALFGGDTSILELWKREVISSVPDTVLSQMELPCVPCNGTLDITQVLNSEFFFA